jgi:uncharacterized membrane protein YfcA
MLWVENAIRILTRLTTFELVLAAGILLLGGLLKGTVGFAVGLVAVAGLVQLFPPKVASVALTIPFLLSNVAVLLRDGVPWDFVRGQMSFLAMLVVGLFVGVAGLEALPPQSLYLLLAVYIGSFLIFQRYETAIERYATSPAAGPVAGTLAGVLGGAVSAPGPPLVIHAYISADDDRVIFVTGASALFLIAHVVRIIFLTNATLIGPAEVWLGILFTLPVFAGVMLGAHYRSSIDPLTFKRLILVLLAIIGLKLAADGLGVL